MSREPLPLASERGLAVGDDTPGDSSIGRADQATLREDERNSAGEVGNVNVCSTTESKDTNPTAKFAGFRSKAAHMTIDLGESLPKGMGVAVRDAVTSQERFRNEMMDHTPGESVAVESTSDSDNGGHFNLPPKEVTIAEWSNSLPMDPSTPIGKEQLRRFLRDTLYLVQGDYLSHGLFSELLGQDGSLQCFSEVADAAKSSRLHLDSPKRRAFFWSILRPFYLILAHSPPTNCPKFQTTIDKIINHTFNPIPTQGLQLLDCSVNSFSSVLIDAPDGSHSLLVPELEAFATVFDRVLLNCSTAAVTNDLQVILKKTEACFAVQHKKIQEDTASLAHTSDLLVTVRHQLHSKAPPIDPTPIPGMGLKLPASEDPSPGKTRPTNEPPAVNLEDSSRLQMLQQRLRRLQESDPSTDQGQQVAEDTGVQYQDDSENDAFAAATSNCPEGEAAARLLRSDDKIGDIMKEILLWGNESTSALGLKMIEAEESTVDSGADLVVTAQAFSKSLHLFGTRKEHVATLSEWEPFRVPYRKILDLYTECSNHIKHLFRIYRKVEQLIRSTNEHEGKLQGALLLLAKVSGGIMTLCLRCDLLLISKAFQLYSNAARVAAPGPSNYTTWTSARNLPRTTANFPVFAISLQRHLARVREQIRSGTSAALPLQTFETNILLAKFIALERHMKRDALHWARFDLRVVGSAPSHKMELEAAKAVDLARRIAQRYPRQIGNLAAEVDEVASMLRGSEFKIHPHGEARRALIHLERDVFRKRTWMCCRVGHAFTAPGMVFGAYRERCPYCDTTDIQMCGVAPAPSTNAMAQLGLDDAAASLTLG